MKTRAFTWNKKAYYNKFLRWTENDSITFGHYNLVEGGCYGEMTMVWDGIGPQLRCYNDAWKVLYNFSDLIEKLGSLSLEESEITQEQFVYILLSCGFVDRTQYEPPERFRISDKGMIIE